MSRQQLSSVVAAATILLIFFIFSTNAANTCKNYKGCCAANFFPSECQPSSDCSCHPLCITTDTCCEDYKTFCHSSKPVNCKYGEWEGWRDHASSTGVQIRMRAVQHFGNLNGEMCTIEDTVDYRQIRPVKTHKMISRALSRLWEDLDEDSLISATVKFTPDRPASCFNNRACVMCNVNNPQCSLLMAKYQTINYEDNTDNTRCYGTISLVDGPLANMGCSEREDGTNDVYVFLDDSEVDLENTEDVMVNRYELAREQWAS